MLVCGLLLATALPLGAALQPEAGSDLPPATTEASLGPVAANNAGCDAAAGEEARAHRGAPEGPCSEDQWMGFDLLYTFIDCIEACSVTATGFKGLQVMSYTIECTDAVEAVIDWANGIENLPDVCQVTRNGDLTGASWTGWGSGDAGVHFVHSDNLANLALGFVPALP